MAYGLCSKGKWRFGNPEFTYSQPEFLLLKNLHKFFNRIDIPWVHLVWAVRYSTGRPPAVTRKGAAPSGGVIFRSFCLHLKEWLWPQWEMAPHVFLA
jgi:hypothetical protein